jgi:hypothetical protein
VVERLGWDPFVAAGGELAIHVAMRRGRARVVVRDAAGELIGERVLSARAECGELARVVALAIAIAIDPHVAFPRRSRDVGALLPGSAPERPAPPAASPEPETRAPAPHSTDDTTAFDPFVGVGVIAEVGAGPEPGAGATVHVGVRRGDLSVAIEARADQSTHADFGGGRVHAALRYGAVVPCAHRGDWLACGVVAAGALRGRGEDFVDPQSVSGTFVGGGARVAWEIPIAPAISARIHADVLGAVARTSLQVGGMDAWTMPPVSAALGVAAMGRFP